MSDGGDTNSFDAARASDSDCRRELAVRLSDLLKTFDWRQQDLADAASIRKDVVSLCIRGKRLPSRSVLRQLAAAFRVTEDDLLPGINRRQTTNGAGPAVYNRFHLTNTGRGRVWLEIQYELDPRTALEIVRIVQGEDTQYHEQSE